MSNLDKIRELIANHKIKAAGQEPRKFIPNGCLDRIFTRENILEALRDQSFKIKPHKVQNTVDFVLKDSKRTFAILVEERLEYSLAKFIENGISDKNLPIGEAQLEPISFGKSAADKFIQRQWEYSAHTFSGGPYDRKLMSEWILPYAEQKLIGGGEFSRVYDVVVHPAHQELESGVKGTV